MSEVAATLEATLALERAVDAIAEFQLQTAGVADLPSLPARAILRDGLVRLLNELDPRVREAAEARCAAAVIRALPVLPCVSRDALAAVMADALADYRHGLQQIPLSGVGRLV